MYTTHLPDGPGTVSMHVAYADRVSFHGIGSGFGAGEFSLLLSPPLVGVLLTGIAAAIALAARLFGRRSSGRLRERLPFADDETVPAETLAGLSKEERFVVGLLRENEGRVHQTEIVEASDWSKSKVSRLLSRMEADGRIEKVPIGRENLIVLSTDGRDW